MAYYGEKIIKNNFPSSPHPPVLTCHLEQDCVVTGLSVIWGCDCGVQQGGVAATELYSEAPVPGGNAGELQPPAVSG